LIPDPAVSGASQFDSGVQCLLGRDVEPGRTAFADGFALIERWKLAEVDEVVATDVIPISGAQSASPNADPARPRTAAHSHP